MNKQNIIGIVAVIALILAIAGISLPASSAPSQLGGTTNYDALQLSEGLNVLNASSTARIDINVNGYGTSTLRLAPSTASTAGCIQFQNYLGSTVRVYVATTTTTLTVEAGTCE